MKKSSSAFTLIELLVVISIIGILAALALPAITGALARGQMTQTLSNMRQLHLATTQMALDGLNRGDADLAWPGDVVGPTFGKWVTSLVDGAYLTAKDCSKLFSAPGKIVPPPAGEDDIPTKDQSALYAYQVREGSEGSTVFLSTKNYDFSTGVGAELDPADVPYGNKGFVIFHKAGDGVVFQKQHATKSDLVGENAAKLD